MAETICSLMCSDKKDNKKIKDKDEKQQKDQR